MNKENRIVTDVKSSVKFNESSCSKVSTNELRKGEKVLPRNKRRLFSVVDTNVNKHWPPKSWSKTPLKPKAKFSPSVAQKVVEEMHEIRDRREQSNQNYIIVTPLVGRQLNYSQTASNGSSCYSTMSNDQRRERLDHLDNFDQEMKKLRASMKAMEPGLLRLERSNVMIKLREKFGEKLLENPWYLKNDSSVRKTMSKQGRNYKAK